ncbi:MAG: NifU family protein [Candidatus Doudnabacteria bacterium]|nr:NifU family protein [Candidatus Doudnabacteria bacterium]
MRDKIQKIIDKIRPRLQADGGDMELIDVDEKQGIVKVRLVGACAHCPMSRITLKQGVESEIKKAVPEVKEVAAV